MNTGIRRASKRLFLSSLIPLMLAYGCGKKEDKGKKQQPPTPVSVVKSETKNIPLVFETFGNIEAFSSVNIKSMVTGKIEKINFTPGQKVSKGQLLVQLDKRPFETVLKQAEAELAKSRIVAKDAKRLAELNMKLSRSGSTAESEMLKIKAIAEASAVTVESELAKIERSKLDIEYCSIIAPFDGVVGDIITDEGSIVKANETDIVNITRIRPAYVTFSLPERLFPKLQELMSQNKNVEITAKVAGTNGTPSTGRLSFIDNTVNLNSGLIKMKAAFENTDEKLWPGQYVEVDVVLSKDDNYTVIPSDAVQVGQNGNYIYVVKKDMTVELRNVTPERTYEGFSAFSKDIRPDETVVLVGHFRLTPGARVSIIEKNDAEMKKKKDEAKGTAK